MKLKFQLVVRIIDKTNYKLFSGNFQELGSEYRHKCSGTWGYPPSPGSTPNSNPEPSVACRTSTLPLYAGEHGAKTYHFMVEGLETEPYQFMTVLFPKDVRREVSVHDVEGSISTQSRLLLAQRTQCRQRGLGLVTWDLLGVYGFMGLGV